MYDFELKQNFITYAKRANGIDIHNTCVSAPNHEFGKHWIFGIKWKKYCKQYFIELFLFAFMLMISRRRRKQQTNRTKAPKHTNVAFSARAMCTDKYFSYLIIFRAFIKSLKITIRVLIFRWRRTCRTHRTCNTLNLKLHFEEKKCWKNYENRKFLIWENGDR